ncbi:MAG: 1-phosphofructokinase family hexose kinase [Fibrobacter sp.]|nr:1-phosphofructokinase family hexose kinase [Fibrobacter sp.]
MIYCTLLNPSIDCLYTLDQFCSGATFVDTKSMTVPAGKGLNVARVVSSLGEKVCIRGIVPVCNLEQVTSFVSRLEIEADLIPVDGSLRINTTIVESTNGAVTHINSAGSSLNESVQYEFERHFKKGLLQGDIYCMSGSLPKGFSNDTYDSLIRYSKEAGCKVMLDTRNDALQMGIRAKPHMIKPNLDELEEYFAEQIRGVHHIALKAKRFLDMGIEYTFISLGEDGMIAVHGNDCLLCNAPRVNAKDTVGCGDALVGGLLVAMQRQFSFPEMCRLAVACGTSKALHKGPGVIDSNEVWQLMEDVEITAV